MVSEIIFLEELLDIENLYLSKFDIKSGTVPIDNLEEIIVKVLKKIITDTTKEIHYTISGLRVILVYKTINKLSISDLVSSRDSLNKYFEKSYLTNHLKYVNHDISYINNIGNHGLVCDVSRNDLLLPKMDGINSNIECIPSLLEWLVIFSQMAQILAYQIDYLDRDKSNTLWMKHVQAEMKGPIVNKKEDWSALGEISKTRLIPMRGATWRTFSMYGEVIESNIIFAGKIAHKLPEKLNEVK